MDGNQKNMQDVLSAMAQAQAGTSASVQNAQTTGGASNYVGGYAGGWYPNSPSCPNCGYCRHCGRSGHYPYARPYPYYSSPFYSGNICQGGASGLNQATQQFQSGVQSFSQAVPGSENAR